MEKHSREYHLLANKGITCKITGKYMNGLSGAAARTGKYIGIKKKTNDNVSNMESNNNKTQN